MYKKILVPLDGSNLAEKAIPHAVNLANGKKDVEIVILHIAQSSMDFIIPYVAEVGGLADPTTLQLEEADALNEKRIEEYLNKIVSSLKEQGLNVKSDVVTGSPANTIVEYADKNKCDIIVMSTHGRSGLARWYLGSVADKVVRAAKVPVLLIICMDDIRPS